MSKRSVNLALASNFVAECERAGVEGPSAITRAVAAIDVARTYAAESDSVSVLDMTPAEVRAATLDLSIKRHAGVEGQGSGLQPGLHAITAAAATEAREASLPELERVVEQLRPRFDQLATVIVAGARDFGFTLTTTAEAVIDRADDSATAAWRIARKAWSDLAPIVNLRRSMNEVFDLRPDEDDLRSTARPMHHGMAPNLTVLFAAGDNWGLDDEFLSGSAIDWFALAHGGLHLNTPAEVDAKLNARRDLQQSRRSPVVVDTSDIDKSIASGRYSIAR